MNKYGLFRVASAVPVVKVADVEYNKEQICNMIDLADRQQVSLIVFPELSITGYTCGDLFSQTYLIEASEAAIKEIKNYTRGKTITAIVGVPIRHNDRLYNCAVVIKNGTIRGIVPKIYLPTYNEFYESRIFASGTDFLSRDNRCGEEIWEDGKNFYNPHLEGVINYAGFKANINPNILFKIGGVNVAVEICEDVWTPIPPSSYHCLAGAHVIANLSASNDVMFKHKFRKHLIADHSSRMISAYIYSSAGYGESSGDIVCSGAALIYENGILLKENERFDISNSMIIADVDVDRLTALRQKMNTFMSVSPNGDKTSDYMSNYLYANIGDAAPTNFEDKFYRTVNPYPLVPPTQGGDKSAWEYEVISLQMMGLVTRLHHIHSKSVIIGVSGGLDSALALIIAVMAFDKLGWDRKGIVAVTMPGFGTTNRTYTNANQLMQALGVSTKEVSIVKSVTQHFKDINQDINKHDIVYENAQARERTQILMDLANMYGGIVVGTGDLSEIALGWSTYNGDHMSMYCVNAGVPKTLVRHLVAWIASWGIEGIYNVKDILSSVLMDIVATPVSPELQPLSSEGVITQNTEDIIGPYELHDFFLFNFIKFGFSPRKIYFFAQHAFDGKDGRPYYSKLLIKNCLKVFYKRFFNHQFKRSCMPDGPKVGPISLSPRGDWRMPSDAKVKLFLDEVEKLN